MQYVVEYMFLKETSVTVEADNVTQARVIVEGHSPVPVRVTAVKEKPPTYPRLTLHARSMREWWIELGPEPDCFNDVLIGPFPSEGAARLYWQRAANSPLQAAKT